MSSHNVYSLRNVFWPLGRSALQATDLLSAAYAAPVSAFCCCSELWTQKSPGTSHFIWYSGTDNLLPAVPPALQTSSSTPLCARNVCCGLPYSENTGSDSSAGILTVQTVSSGVFPIVSFPPSALSVGDAKFLSSFRNRVSFIAFWWRDSSTVFFSAQALFQIFFL